MCFGKTNSSDLFLFSTWMLKPFWTFQCLEGRPLQSNIFLPPCTLSWGERMFFLYFKQQPTQRKVSNLSPTFIRGRKAAADVHSSTSKWIAVTSTVVSAEKKNACPTSPYNEDMWPDKWKNVSQKIVCIPKYPRLCREYSCLLKLFHNGTGMSCAAIILRNEREELQSTSP